MTEQHETTPHAPDEHAPDEHAPDGPRPPQRERRTPPRWVRRTLVGVAGGLLCLVFGVTSATAELSFGPHEAVYAVDTDGLVVADLGPLGTVEIDSPLPLGLGVEVTVKEIPADLSAVGAASTLDALGEDLESYLQFFSSPDVAVRSVAWALAVDAVRRTALAAVVLVLGALALRGLLGVSRRRELAAAVAPRTWEITAGVAVVGLVATTVVAGGVVPPTQGTTASPVFAGTALEGARITGRLSGVIDTYGGQLVELYDENEAFYAAADDNLVDAWNSWEVRQAVRDGAPGASEAETGQPDETPAETPGETPDGASASPSADPEDLVTMLVVSDLHCNTAMAPLIRTVAERSDADLLLNAGDTTTNGTSVEKACVDAFASAVPRGTKVVVADGNHDSAETSKQEAAHGQVILDGDVVEVAGVRILGDRDALETRVGSGTAVARETTPEEQGAALAQTACEDGEVDLLMIHTAPVGLDAMESGCVPFQVSGHTHRRAGPEQVGQGIRYVNASTAGAAPNQPTVGPLRGTAEMTLLRFDPELRRVVDWQLVEVDPAGEAVVRDRLPVPEIVPPAEDVLSSSGVAPPEGEGTTDPSPGP
ncbi:metallophosphoesterase family protein [Isoptericola cucumis]|nr:metallophosphoesterase [Isoptericola cucumis]